MNCVLTEEEFHNAFSSLSFDNAPRYTDTSDKNHRWLLQKVTINFTGNIYPSTQDLYITRVDIPYIDLAREPILNCGNHIRVNIDRDYDVYKQISDQLD